MSLIILQYHCLTMFKANYIYLLTIIACVSMCQCAHMDASTEARGLRFPRTGVIGG